MENNNILYVPIQINGGNSTSPELFDRELYVIDNGTLYIGIKKPDGSIAPTVVAGRVVENATITRPTLVGPITLGSNIIVTDPDSVENKAAGQLYLVDEGNF